jgi:hypothetical protein
VSVVDGTQLSALARLQPLLPEASYLAGGVAVAMHFEHRRSRDLNVFVAGDFDARALAERLTDALPDAIVRSIAERTLYLDVAGIPTSVIGYRHALVEPVVIRRLTEGATAAVAAPADLLAMKLAAVADRGAAKDFWDIDVMLEAGVAGGEVEGALALFARKYPHADAGFVLRALTYFAEALAAPLPLGLGSEAWQQLEDRSTQRVRAYLAALRGR